MPVRAIGDGLAANPERRAGRDQETRPAFPPPVWERFRWTANVMNCRRPAPAPVGAVVPADGGAGAGRWLWATGGDKRPNLRMAEARASATSRDSAEAMLYLSRSRPDLTHIVLF